MSTVTRRNPFAKPLAAWNWFWFAPSDPATLSAIRLFGGAMLFYTHLIWTLGLSAFFGTDGWLPLATWKETHAARSFAWSYFAWIDSPGLLWTVHVLALVVFFLLMIGLFSRIVAPIAFFAVVAYANRISPGAYFGLDKVNCMIALYVMLGPCGARYSVDRLLARQGDENEPVASSSFATLAVRLLQVHLCIFYFFAATSKLQGFTWWDGSAFWWGSAITEYQSFDMTWVAGWPKLVALATYGSVLWEGSYPFLVWNRYTRPVMLAGAVIVHGGIALTMGMITFGLSMLIANIAFLSPATVRRVLERKK